MTISPVTPLQTLITARALISGPEHWVKRKLFARYYPEENARVTCTRQEADCFCMLGAVIVANWALSPDNPPSDHRNVYREALIQLSRHIPDDGCTIERHPSNRIYTFNDATPTTHADVLRVFDAAINNLIEGGNNAG